MLLADLFKERIDGKGDYQGSWTELFQIAEEHELADRDRYLSLIVSTLIDCGAQEVDIERTAAKLTVEAKGAYLSKKNQQLSLLNLFHPKPHPGADLAIALLMAASHGIEEFKLTSLHEQLKSYTWNGETYEDVEHEEPTGMRLEIKFEASMLDVVTGWFRSFREEEDSAECLSLKQTCLFSRTVVRVEEKVINSPFPLPSAPIALERGESPPFDFDGRVIQKPAASWNGVVALVRGQIQLVVRGLLFPGPEGLDLHGLVNCDDLHLDLGRQEVVKNDLYEKIVADLRKLHKVMLGAVDLSAADVGWFSENRDYLLQPSVSSRLADHSKDQLARRLTQIPEGDVDENNLPTLKFLFQQARRYHKTGRLKELDITAEKAYQRARLLFDNIGLNTELIDMCAQLCTWISERRVQSYAWEILATARRLRRNRGNVVERLTPLLKAPIGKEGRAIIYLALWNEVGRRRKGREYLEQFKNELQSHPSKFVQMELMKLSKLDSKSVRSVLAGKMHHMATYEEEVRLAVESAER